MRKVLLGVGLSMGLSVAAVPVMSAETFTLDSSHTYPNFEISHLGFSTLHGSFNKTKGSMIIDWAKKTGSVSVVIDAASVDTGMKKRDDHLRNPDFLTVEEFPEITFKSTNVVIHDDKSAMIDGDLTMMGVTKPVQLNVAKISCGNHPMRKGIYVCGMNAKGKIKRSDFGLTFGLPAIGDEMVLDIEVEGTRN